eukprot:scaffold227307_cov17-Tisochrysis_lutea.AAC.1
MLSLQSVAQSNTFRARGSSSVSSRTRHLTIRSSNCDAASVRGEQCGAASSHAYHQSNPAADSLQPELQQPEMAPSAAAIAFSASQIKMRRAVRRLLRTVHSTKWWVLMCLLLTQSLRDHVDLAGPMAMGFVCPVLPGGGFQDLLANRVLITGFIAWFAAQFGKVRQIDGFAAQMHNALILLKCSCTLSLKMYKDSEQLTGRQHIGKGTVPGPPFLYEFQFSPTDPLRSPPGDKSTEEATIISSSCSLTCVHKIHPCLRAFS